MMQNACPGLAPWQPLYMVTRIWPPLCISALLTSSSAVMRSSESFDRASQRFRIAELIAIRLPGSTGLLASYTVVMRATALCGMGYCTTSLDFPGGVPCTYSSVAISRRSLCSCRNWPMMSNASSRFLVA